MCVKCVCRCPIECVASMPCACTMCSACLWVCDIGVWKWSNLVQKIYINNNSEVENEKYLINWDGLIVKLSPNNSEVEKWKLSN